MFESFVLAILSNPIIEPHPKERQGEQKRERGRGEEGTDERERDEQKRERRGCKKSGRGVGFHACECVSLRIHSLSFIYLLFYFISYF